jgi:hypothetical protein
MKLSSVGFLLVCVVCSSSFKLLAAEQQKAKSIQTISGLSSLKFEFDDVDRGLAAIDDKKGGSCQFVTKNAVSKEHQKNFQISDLVYPVDIDMTEEKSEHVKSPQAGARPIRGHSLHFQVTLSEEEALLIDCDRKSNKEPFEPMDLEQAKKLLRDNKIILSKDAGQAPMHRTSPVGGADSKPQ